MIDTIVIINFWIKQLFIRKQGFPFFYQYDAIFQVS